jgi:hypothetical protein
VNARPCGSHVGRLGRYVGRERRPGRSTAAVPDGRTGLSLLPKQLSAAAPWATAEAAERY